MIRADDIVSYLRERGHSPTTMWTRDIEACVVDHIAIPALAKRGGLSWTSDGAAFREWRGSVMIVPSRALSGMGAQKPATVAVVVENPRLAMVHVMQRWFADVPTKVTVGDPVNVHPDAVIGCEGFAYELDGGHYERFPSVAGVVLGDGVDVAAGAVISRGCLTDTVIGDGTKVGHCVHVGRGARIGKHCLVAPGATVGGSAVIGDRVKVWMHASIGHGVRIGDGATIGMGAVVLSDVPPGETWAGNPARCIRGRDGH